MTRVTDEQARQAAREILAREEFTRWEEDLRAWIGLVEQLIELVPAWLIGALDGLQRALAWLVGGIERGLEAVALLPGLPALLSWLAVALGVAGAIVLVRQGWAARRRRRAGGLDSATARTHAAASREARALARDGRFLEAAHRLQLATLALLVEFGWLELARADANPTLRRRIAASPLPARERRELVALVDRLEALWFDEPAEDPDLYAAWLSLDERIASLVAASAAEAPAEPFDDLRRADLQGMAGR